MTRFQLNDKVTGNAQGLTAGTIYTVDTIREVGTSFGTLVTYIVVDDVTGEQFAINNGHLVLDHAA